MKKYFGLFILIFLTFSFFSCEKKNIKKKIKKKKKKKKKQFIKN